MAALTAGFALGAAALASTGGAAATAVGAAAEAGLASFGGQCVAGFLIAKALTELFPPVSLESGCLVVTRQTSNCTSGPYVFKSTVTLVKEVYSRPRGGNQARLIWSDSFFYD
jgi:hypothetical protein